MTKNTQILVIGVLVLVFCVASGLVVGLYHPYDNGGPGFEHTTAYNEAHGLTVTVGGVPVPVTWQTDNNSVYTTDVIEGTPDGAIINGVLYQRGE